MPPTTAPARAPGAREEPAASPPPPPPPTAAGAEGDGAPDDEGNGSTAAAPTVKVGAADAEAAPAALRCEDAVGAGVVVELPAVPEALAVTEGEVDTTRVARGEAVGLLAVLVKRGEVPFVAVGSGEPDADGEGDPVALSDGEAVDESVQKELAEALADAETVEDRVRDPVAQALPLPLPVAPAEADVVGVAPAEAERDAVALPLNEAPAVALLVAHGEAKPEDVGSRAVPVGEERVVEDGVAVMVTMSMETVPEGVALPRGEPLVVWDRECDADAEKLGVCVLEADSEGEGVLEAVGDAERESLGDADAEEVLEGAADCVVDTDAHTLTLADADARAEDVALRDWLLLPEGLPLRDGCDAVAQAEGVDETLCERVAEALPPLGVLVPAARSSVPLGEPLRVSVGDAEKLALKGAVADSVTLRDTVGLREPHAVGELVEDTQGDDRGLTVGKTLADGVALSGGEGDAEPLPAPARALGEPAPLAEGEALSQPLPLGRLDAEVEGVLLCDTEGEPLALEERESTALADSERVTLSVAVEERLTTGDGEGETDVEGDADTNGLRLGVPDAEGLLLAEVVPDVLLVPVVVRVAVRVALAVALLVEDREPVEVVLAVDVPVALRVAVLVAVAVGVVRAVAEALPVAVAVGVVRAVAVALPVAVAVAVSTDDTVAAGSLRARGGGRAAQSASTRRQSNKQRITAKFPPSPFGLWTSGNFKLGGGWAANLKFQLQVEGPRRPPTPPPPATRSSTQHPCPLPLLTPPLRRAH